MLQKKVESIGEAKVSKFEICRRTEMGLGQAITLLFTYICIVSMLSIKSTRKIKTRQEKSWQVSNIPSTVMPFMMRVHLVLINS